LFNRRPLAFLQSNILEPQSFGTLSAVDEGGFRKKCRGRMHPQKYGGLFQQCMKRMQPIEPDIVSNLYITGN
jgi:hypothetical protein